MIVYGDCIRRTTLGTVLSDLTALFDSATSPDDGGASPDLPAELIGADTLDDRRRLLVVAGELEQAIEDGIARGEVDAAAGTPSRTLTDAASRWFLEAWQRSQGRSGPEGGAAAPSAMVVAIEQLARLGRRHESGVPLRVTSPEGFGCYVLLPDQYAAAAWTWSSSARDGAASGERLCTPARVGVIGIRSIGTSLSAVVACTLAARGVVSTRMTVRPVGAHDARLVDAHVEHAPLGDIEHLLVVDEGPGQSGSSMAAVVTWLGDAGVEVDSISLMPSHDGDPGNRASPAVRALWERTPRVHTGRSSLRWWQRSLPELLAASTPASTRVAEIVGVDDFGGSLWLGAVDACPAPSAPAAFDRAKYRVRRADGSAVLWKFVGIDDRATVEQMRHRSRAGWGVPPLARRAGFVAAPWIDAPVPSTLDLEPATLDRLGAYLCAVAAPAAERDRQIDAVGRLAEMLYWNVWEAIGAEAADRTRLLAADVTAAASAGEWAVAGDGRMGPEHWRSIGGEMVKVNAFAHDDDHTAIGAQSIAWDVAGVVVEWNLDPAQRASIVSAVAELGHHDAVAEQPMALHELAYLSFRLGQCAVGSAGLHADEEGPAPGDRYRARLVSALEAATTVSRRR